MTSVIPCSPVTGEAGADAGIDGYLLVLEATAERLLAAGDAGGALSPDAARRLRRIGEELSIHVLALQVLLTSGVALERVRPLLDRATALVDEEWEHNLRLVESSNL